MEIQLPNDVASIAATVASSKGYETVADYIAALVKRESELDLASTKPASYQQLPDWINRLREWSASHPPSSHFVDTSRDSIYGDRGL